MDHAGFQFIVQRGRSLFGAFQGSPLLGRMLGHKTARSVEQTSDTVTRMTDLLQLALALSPRGNEGSLNGGPSRLEGINGLSSPPSPTHHNGNGDDNALNR
jgi:hypothetical protein